MTYNSVEVFDFPNISATTAAFILRGGKYGITVHAASFGTVTLQRLALDGVTYVPSLTTTFSADGYASASLPPG